MLSSIFKSCMTVISLLTALGVFMHDGRVDRATLTAVNPRFDQAHLSATTYLRFKDFIDTDAHTHPDHNAGKSLFSGFQYQSPSIAPRRDSHHKQLKSFLEGSRHAFDNTNLPVLD